VNSAKPFQSARSLVENACLADAVRARDSHDHQLASVHVLNELAQREQRRFASDETAR
jgi:hypothetical protein